MSINSVNYNLNSSYGAYNQKLTPQTKAKLDELGVAYSPNITEAEGKQLLAAAKAKKARNDGSDFQGSNQSKNDLFERAKKLAGKLGINVDEQMGIKQVLATIEQALMQKISAASNNVQELNILKDLGRELNLMQSEVNGSSGYNNKNQALMMSLEMLGEYNKNFLNR